MQREDVKCFEVAKIYSNELVDFSVGHLVIACLQSSIATSGPRYLIEAERGQSEKNSEISSSFAQPFAKAAGRNTEYGIRSVEWKGLEGLTECLAQASLHYAQRAMFIYRNREKRDRADHLGLGDQRP